MILWSEPLRLLRPAYNYGNRDHRQNADSDRCLLAAGYRQQLHRLWYKYAPLGLHLKVLHIFDVHNLGCKYLRKRRISP
jgi:hypothetical protein